MVERSVDAGKLPEADVEDEDEDEDVEDDKNALGLGMAKGALSVAKKTEYDVSLGMAPSDECRWPLRPTVGTAAAVRRRRDE
ncbi:hypothetical protein PF010_g19993 [Phytophthora fragariae]|uniref:Uncharacterized protein n=1 Tax=Phytophthora fragariae TaxID=53985 RepID=A0A6A3XNW3_9STRA|nr:hypothetical protein PF011_g26541 [Phytophthora fragariae]KAE9086690.1 hypothetical protein PF010_g19993 [Phytophthora fragariae]KAE9114439.1 hypothetical protein PF006_g19523 [Phytophthora fragariae]KAE9200790.1 hypothetical protein PF002_g21726 [Phytophthora fragariae]KAE9290131.1 hypothetical protein PF001_g19735 [Phytophthora fragariae]